MFFFYVSKQFKIFVLASKNPFGGLWYEIVSLVYLFRSLLIIRLLKICKVLIYFIDWICFLCRFKLVILFQQLKYSILKPNQHLLHLWISRLDKQPFLTCGIPLSVLPYIVNEMSHQREHVCTLHSTQVFNFGNIILELPLYFWLLPSCLLNKPVEVVVLFLCGMFYMWDVLWVRDVL